MYGEAWYWDLGDVFSSWLSCRLSDLPKVTSNLSAPQYPICKTGRLVLPFSPFDNVYLNCKPFTVATDSHFRFTQGLL